MPDPSTTRKDIRQKVIKKLYRGRHPIVGTTTTASSDTLSIIDSALAPSGNAEDYRGAWVYVAETESGSPAVGEIARVTNVDFSGDSNLITAPAFSASMNSGMDYELHYYYHPSVINDVINEFLSNVKMDTIIPISEVTAAENLTSPIVTSTNWTVTAGSTTQASYGSTSTKVVTSNATNSGIVARVATDPTMIWFFSMDFYAETAAVWTFSILNSTTGDTLISDTITTAAGKWYTVCFPDVEAPSTCYILDAKASANATAETIYFDNVTFLPTDRRVFKMNTATLDRWDDIDGIWYQPFGSAVFDTQYIYQWQQLPLEKWCDFSIIHDVENPSSVKIELITENLIKNPLFIRARTQYSTVSSDTTTVYAPEDYIVELVLAELFESRAIEDLDNDKYEGYSARMLASRNVKEKIAFTARNNSRDKARVKGSFSRTYNEKGIGRPGRGPFS